MYKVACGKILPPSFPQKDKKKIENKRKNERSQTQENAAANFL
jgi:hypothetical protein